MQKLKKALKKLVEKAQPAAAKSLAAKKATPAKKKAGPLPKKPASKKPEKAQKKVAAKPAAKKAAAAEKPKKTAHTKTAPVAQPKMAAKPAKGAAKPEPKPAKGKEKEALKKPAAEVKAKKAPAIEEPIEEILPETPAEDTAEDEVFLTDAEGRRYCRVRDCDQISTVDGYCRYHYLLFWKKIQVRKKILTEGKLERYIEELTSRYPDKYLEMLRKDLRSEKDFLAAIQELEIDESGVDAEFEDEAQNYLDEVRGMSPANSGNAESGQQEDDF